MWGLTSATGLNISPPNYRDTSHHAIGGPGWYVFCEGRAVVKEGHGRVVGEVSNLSGG